MSSAIPITIKMDLADPCQGPDNPLRTFFRLATFHQIELPPWAAENRLSGTGSFLKEKLKITITQQLFLSLPVGVGAYQGERRSVRADAGQARLPCPRVRRQHERMHVGRPSFQSSGQGAWGPRCGCPSCWGSGKYRAKCGRSGQGKHLYEFPMNRDKNCI